MKELTTVPGATVLVADAELHTSLLLIRSLARAGLRVIAVAHREGFGTYSRCPSVRRIVQPDCDYTRTILETAADYGAVAVFAHYETTLLSLHEQRSDAGPIVIGPGREQLQMTMHKSNVLSRAAALGLRVPKTIVLSRDDQEAWTRMNATFRDHRPLFAKSDTEVGANPGPGSRYLVLHRAGDLVALEELIERRGSVLVQEYVTGHGAGIAGFFWEGRPLCVGGHVRLRESHANGGASTYCESRIIPAAWDATMVLMKSLSWTGQGMVEFKITPEGEAVLMEINPRFWGSLPLYIDAGLDVPLAAYGAFVLGDTQPRWKMKEGRRMRMLVNDIPVVLAQTRGATRIVKLFGILASTPWIVGDYAFSWRDPAPFVLTIMPFQIARWLWAWCSKARRRDMSREGRSS